MISTIREGLDFVRKNHPRRVWSEFIKHDTHPFLQFVKYGFCGVAAVVVHTTVFWALGYTVLPAHKIVDGVPIEKVQMMKNYAIAQTIGFLASDIAAYLLNLAFVFKGGRHHRVLEFFLFTAVASIGFIIGLALSEYQLYYELGGSWSATLTLIVTSTLVNFVCRKFIIFKS